MNEEKKIVGVGYNGMPTGCSDDILPWNRASPNSALDTKYPYVCHAEMNGKFRVLELSIGLRMYFFSAIMNKNSADVKRCDIYVTMFPCNECAKLIIQSGIKRIVYMRDKPEKPEMQASKRLFDMCGIKYE